ncbi:MAG: hypothetical protein M3P87_02360 [Actinomycetota bacterium]|nr:hypothetical protein [Actinomycetota bacterium]
MTIEQIDRMVRASNPVPDPRALEPVDLSTLRVTQQRSGDMQTQNRVETDKGPDRPQPGLLIGAAAVVLLLIGALVVFQNREAPEEPVASTAVEVATSFLEAYAAYDVDQATTYLADGTDISTLGGSLQVWRLRNEFSKAVGFKMLLDSCEPIASSATGTKMRCAYDYHSFLSDEIGRGPFSGNWFDLTILDGKIVTITEQFSIGGEDGFSSTMWEPFAQWLVENHPDDLLVLYTDSSQSLEMRTQESIPLWEQRIQEWAAEVGGTG